MRKSDEFSSRMQETEELKRYLSNLSLSSNFKPPKAYSNLSKEDQPQPKPETFASSRPSPSYTISSDPTNPIYKFLKEENKLHLVERLEEEAKFKEMKSQVNDSRILQESLIQRKELFEKMEDLAKENVNLKNKLLEQDLRYQEKIKHITEDFRIIVQKKEEMKEKNKEDLELKIRSLIENLKVADARLNDAKQQIDQERKEQNSNIKNLQKEIETLKINEEKYNEREKFYQGMHEKILSQENTINKLNKMIDILKNLEAEKVRKQLEEAKNVISDRLLVFQEETLKRTDTRFTGLLRKLRHSENQQIKRVKTWKQIKEDLDSQVDGYKEALQLKEREYENIISKIKDELKKTEDDLDESKNQYDKLKKEKRDLEKSSNLERQKVREEMEDLKQTIDKLERDMAEMKEMNASLLAKKGEYESLINELGFKNEFREKEIKELKIKQENFYLKLEEGKKSNEDLRSSVSCMEDQDKKQKEQIARYEEILAENGEEMKNQKNEIERLKDETRVMKELMITMDKELSENKLEQKMQKEKFNEKEEQHLQTINSQVKDIAKMLKEIESKDEMIDKIHSERKSFNGEIEEEIKKQKEQIKRYEEILDEDDETMKKQKEEIAKLSKENKEMKGLMEVMDRKIDNLDCERNSFNGEIARREGEIRKQKEQIERYEEILNEYDEIMKNQKEEIAKLSKENKEMKSLMEVMDRKIDDLNLEKNSMKGEITLRDEEINNQKKQHERYENEKTQQIDELKQQQKNLENIKNEKNENYKLKEKFGEIERRICEKLKLLVEETLKKLDIKLISVLRKFRLFETKQLQRVKEMLAEKGPLTEEVDSLQEEVNGYKEALQLKDREHENIIKKIKQELAETENLLGKSERQCQKLREEKKEMERLRNLETEKSEREKQTLTEKFEKMRSEDLRDSKEIDRKFRENEEKLNKMKAEYDVLLTNQKDEIARLLKEKFENEKLLKTKEQEFEVILAKFKSDSESIHKTDQQELEKVKNKAKEIENQLIEKDQKLKEYEELIQSKFADDPAKKEKPKKAPNQLEIDSKLKEMEDLKTQEIDRIIKNKDQILAQEIERITKEKDDYFRREIERIKKEKDDQKAQEIEAVLQERNSTWKNEIEMLEKRQNEMLQQREREILEQEREERQEKVRKSGNENELEKILQAKEIEKKQEIERLIKAKEEEKRREIEKAIQDIEEEKEKEIARGVIIRQAQLKKEKDKEIEEFKKQIRIDQENEIKQMEADFTKSQRDNAEIQKEKCDGLRNEIKALTLQLETLKEKYESKEKAQNSGTGKEKLSEKSQSEDKKNNEEEINALKNQIEELKKKHDEDLATQKMEMSLKFADELNKVHASHPGRGSLSLRNTDSPRNDSNNASFLSSKETSFKESENKSKPANDGKNKETEKKGQNSPPSLWKK